MKVTFDDTEHNIEKNEELTHEVQTDSELKDLIVNYVDTNYLSVVVADKFSNVPVADTSHCNIACVVGPPVLS